ncbi:MAG: 6-bladed beta-propeller [Gemmatimonadetes bacterium]|nr:6-bladed beta-propeller [Gemmatimonadota bacterium]
MVRAYAVLSSIIPIRVFLIAGALVVGTVAGCKENTNATQQVEVHEESIPERPLRYAGKVALELQETFQLGFDKDMPGIGRVEWMGISPEGTLMVTDDVTHQAHEINYLDNKYIRSFGRSGRGPGEHVSAKTMTIDNEGRVYLLDAVRGQILRYDRKGRYLDQTQSYNTSNIHAGRNGDIFFLRVNSSLIVELQRRDRATWDVLSRTPLSNRNQSFVSYRMRPMPKLCYNASLQALYYLGPNDYLVKEIDAVTGEITAKFGRRPNGYVALPDRYHDIERGTLEDMQQLDITTVESMTLVEDRYLFVSYNHPKTLEREWVIYMINPSGTIDVFDLDDDTSRLLHPFSPDPDEVEMGAITGAQELIYIWRPPLFEVADRSNGTLEKYAVKQDLH